MEQNISPTYRWFLFEIAGFPKFPFPKKAIPFWGDIGNPLVVFGRCICSLRIQSPCQMMIGVYNHLLSKVFRFHYHSQKVIGSQGARYNLDEMLTCCCCHGWTFSFSAYCRRCRLRRRFRQSLGCALAPRPPVFFSPGRGRGTSGTFPALSRRNTTVDSIVFWEVKTNFAEKYKEIRNPPFFWLGAVGEAKNYQRQVADGFFWPTISYILNH